MATPRTLYLPTWVYMNHIRVVCAKLVSMARDPNVFKGFTAQQPKRRQQVQAPLLTPKGA